MRWAIPLGGGALSAFHVLTTWWGIAAIAVFALIHLLDALTGVDRAAREVSGGPDVYELLRFLLVTVPMVIAVFVGDALWTGWGALFAGMGAGTLGNLLWARTYARTEAEIVGARADADD